MLTPISISLSKKLSICPALNFVHCGLYNLDSQFFFILYPIDLYVCSTSATHPYYHTLNFLISLTVCLLNLKHTVFYLQATAVYPSPNFKASLLFFNLLKICRYLVLFALNLCSSCSSLPPVVILWKQDT